MCQKLIQGIWGYDIPNIMYDSTIMPEDTIEIKTPFNTSNLKRGDNYKYL